MKVLRVFHGGGVPAYQRRDEELARLGHSVQLVVPRSFRELPTLTVAKARKDLIRVSPVGLYGLKRNPFFFYNPLEIAGILRKFGPDLLDLHEEPYSLAALSVIIGRALAKSRCKVIFRSSQNEYKEYPFPFSAIQSLVFRVGQAAYVPSSDAKTVLIRKAFKKPVSVIGNGVTLPKIMEMSARRSANLEVTCVGRLIERKGVQDLVAAVIASNPRVRLTIVGSGPMDATLRSTVKERGAEAIVSFTGPLSMDEAATIMSQADVICVPSHVLSGWSEQFSRALVEGMANYCVPLVSDSGALPEISGSIFPPFAWGDVQELTSKLDELIDRADLDKLKAAAHEHAIGKYSWQATSQQLSDLYEAVR